MSLAAMPQRLAVLALGIALASAPASVQRSTQPSITPQELARLWDAEHVSPPLPPLVDHAEVMQRLEKAVAASGGMLQMEKLGESVEGRSINLVRLGTGPMRVMLPMPERC